MNASRMPKELAQLFEALGLGIAVHVNYDPTSPLSEDEQVAAAIARAEAEHRKECAGCRAEYEAEQAAAKSTNGDVGAGLKDTDKATSRDRIVVGYMAYVGDTPIKGTFNEVHNDVQGAINEFTNDIGSDSGLTVKPVYG